MKCRKQNLFFLIVTLTASASFAGYAVNCDNPKNQTEAYWCAYAGNNANQGNPKFENYLPQGSYCDNHYGHIEGWSFENSVSRVTRINSYAGMPSPNIKFSFFWGSLPGVFFIREQKINGSLLKDHGPFKWISADAFSDRMNIYTLGRCGR